MVCCYLVNVKQIPLKRYGTVPMLVPYLLYFVNVKQIPLERCGMLVLSQC